MPEFGDQHRLGCSPARPRRRLSRTRDEFAEHPAEGRVVAQRLDVDPGLAFRIDGVVDDGDENAVGQIAQDLAVRRGSQVQRRAGP